ncbi:MAG: cytochrome c [Candidatus Zeuxoniibacter abyssi]|nr:MAG: cytochrome c [Candidatus Persebacteraceae bacterium AB1(2)]
MALEALLRFAIFSLILCTFGVQALAAESGGGDVKVGEELYNVQCVTCHGSSGQSIVPTQPILSGQHDEYLHAQIKAYRDGERQNPVMAGFAKNLSDEDIVNIAAYLSSQTPAIAGAADIELAKSAENLYRGGNIARGIAACGACHGPAGEGVVPFYPRLSGQHAAYTEATLREFAAGTRKNDIMNTIAAQLTEDEIKALAAYISGLAP